MADTITNMSELSIEKFNPTVAELNKLVEASKAIVVTDIDDKEQMEVVKRQRITLRDTRVQITKTGKQLREEALAFQKSVIDYERGLVAIIEPEEERLRSIEEEVKAKKLRIERLGVLPMRRDALTAIGDGIEVADELLLEMDENAFGSYYNSRVAAKNEAERVALEIKQREVREAEEKAARDAEIKRREEQARIDERARIEKVEADKKSREEAERLEAEEKAKAEQAALEKKRKYVAWLKENGYTKENANLFKVEDRGTEVVLYKLVGTYQK